MEPAKSVYTDMFSARLISCNLLCSVFLEPRLPGSNVKKLQKWSSKRLKREKKGVDAHWGLLLYLLLLKLGRKMPWRMMGRKKERLACYTRKVFCVESYVYSGFNISAYFNLNDLWWMWYTRAYSFLPQKAFYFTFGEIIHPSTLSQGSL